MLDAANTAAKPSATAAVWPTMPRHKTQHHGQPQAPALLHRLDQHKNVVGPRRQRQNNRNTKEGDKGFRWRAWQSLSKRHGASAPLCIAAQPRMAS